MRRKQEIISWINKTVTLKEIEIVSLTDGEIELKSSAGIICLYLNQTLNEELGFKITKKGGMRNENG